MAIYEFRVAGYEKPGSLRINYYDITSVKSHPGSGSLHTYKMRLIVLIESNKTLEQLRDRYMTPMYVNGKTQHEMYAEEAMSKAIGGSYTWPAQTAMRMFSIPLAKIVKEFPDLESKKITDMSKIYQPFKKQSDILYKFDGLEGCMYIDPKDVDVGDSTDIGEKETEHVIPLNTKCIYNKYTSQYEAA